MKTIKKYSNRRLYDTDQSKYVTLEELAMLIRDGHDVEVVDASSGDDLTQSVLAQIVVESRGAARLLPVPLLTQMIRMEEDALAEFMSLYMTWALDVYMQVKQGFGDINPYKLFGGTGFGFNPTRALGDIFSQAAPPWMRGWRSEDKPIDSTSSDAAPPPVDEEPPPEVSEDEEGVDMELLRREIKRLNERLDEMEGDE